MGVGGWAWAHLLTYVCVYAHRRTSTGAQQRGAQASAAVAFSKQGEGCATRRRGVRGYKVHVCKIGALPGAPPRQQPCTRACSTLLCVATRSSVRACSSAAAARASSTRRRCTSSLVCSFSSAASWCRRLWVGGGWGGRQGHTCSKRRPRPCNDRSAASSCSRLHLCWAGQAIDPSGSCPSSSAPPPPSPAEPLPLEGVGEAKREFPLPLRLRAPAMT